MAATQDEPRAPNSCRTCRQKRVRCDRLLPACQRCCSLKLRCLGYAREKTLVWTNSMASRGKMMGKRTFDEGNLPEKTATHCSVEIELAESRLEEASLLAAVSWSLTEPGLQDLTQDCRKYIRYFDLELSKECVVYNDPSANPFLALMPLMPGSKALSHIMISISAFHFTHRIVIQQHSHDASRPERWYSEKTHAWQLDQPSSRESLQMALSHKDKALQCLKRELQVHSGRNSDAVIATVILFICMDVVEFGGRGWKHHLNGAEEMIKSRKMLSKDSETDSAAWLKYFDTACTTFGIMGATLAQGHLIPSQPTAFLDPSFLQTLQQSEHQTWVGCPAELLFLLSAVNALRFVSPTTPERPQTISAVCDSLASFSPSTWAKNFPDQQHYESRFHLACAYKAAVEVYASHIIGAPAGEQYLSRAYILDIAESAILQMLSIPSEDFHIKSLVWPAFVLGAETQNAELRQAVRTIFRHIWTSSCCYNARNAAEMLDVIWAREPWESAEKTWLEFVWEREESWLFV